MGSISVGFAGFRCDVGGAQRNLGCLFFRHLSHIVGKISAFVFKSDKSKEIITKIYALGIPHTVTEKNICPLRIAVIEIKGKASTKAKNKYNAANYDSLRIVVPKGRKADVEAYAKNQIGGTYEAVAVAMMRYGDSVAAYAAG